MNSVPPLYRRVAVLVLWLLVICLAAHFLHDLQPGHLDLQGTGPGSRVCHLAIHSGALGGLVPGITMAALVFSVISFPQLVDYSGSRSVPIPPPILA
jgi:hypothetical protein